MDQKLSKIMPLLSFSSHFDFGNLVFGYFWWCSYQSRAGQYRQNGNLRYKKSRNQNVEKTKNEVTKICNEPGTNLPYSSDISGIYIFIPELLSIWDTRMIKPWIMSVRLRSFKDVGSLMQNACQGIIMLKRNCFKKIL